MISLPSVASVLEWFQMVLSLAGHLLIDVPLHLQYLQHLQHLLLIVLEAPRTTSSTYSQYAVNDCSTMQSMTFSLSILSTVYIPRTF